MRMHVEVVDAEVVGSQTEALKDLPERQMPSVAMDDDVAGTLLQLCLYKPIATECAGMYLRRCLQFIDELWWTCVSTLRTL